MRNSDAHVCESALESVDVARSQQAVLDPSEAAMLYTLALFTVLLGPERRGWIARRRRG